MMFVSRLIHALAAPLVACSAWYAMAEVPQQKAQSPGWYRMMVGGIEVTALNDGTGKLPVDKLLANIAPERLRELLAQQYLTSPVETSVNAYLINAGGKLVLIDSGAGTLYGPAFGKLLMNLRAAGYQPEQVDEVYITHMHSDHVGGLVAGGARAFPNATVRVDSRDADLVTDSSTLNSWPEAGRNSFRGAAAAVQPYIAAGRFKPFDGETELVAGVRAVPAYGHTPGHSLYIVESLGSRLVLWGDLMHVAAVQFTLPQTTIQFDADAAAASAQRRKNYAEVAENGDYVAGAHLSFPGIGRLRVQAEGSGLQWIPVNYSAAP